MLIPKRVQIAVLVCLVAALGAVIYVRGFGLTLGGPPAALQSEHKTEEDWITNEIVRDTATIQAPNRLMGVQFRSHPIAGWAEK